MFSGKPDAGNLPVRFDEGRGGSNRAAPLLLHRLNFKPVEMSPGATRAFAICDVALPGPMGNERFYFGFLMHFARHTPRSGPSHGRGGSSSPNLHTCRKIAGFARISAQNPYWQMRNLLLKAGLSLSISTSRFGFPS